MNTSLPIYNYLSEITEAIKNHAVTIITAETGSGKSTQVPQYAHNAGYDVVVTEPRRMAAWSLAERVAEEMETPLGETVGFRTALERNDSQNTSILYCTDGLELVRSLTDTKNKPKVLVIDEVHEWNSNIETLIGWSKKKIQEGWCTKVVIMSATLEKESLAEYFGEDVYSLEVPGRLFPVSFEERSEMHLIPSITEMVSEGRNTLVFVPGKKEIAEVIEELSSNNVKAKVLPLHGELDSEEQKKCFDSYSIPKVIVATNVAQTSITIPDIDAVVDTGKERRLETHDGIQGLFLRDTSKADCMQRKGRAGRTKEGRYILCSDTYFDRREEFSVPEIQRCLLEQTVLRLATIGIDAVEFPFFHQPKVEELVRAKETLINLGALKEDNTVTHIGYKMAKIPVGVQSARMIIEAEKYGVTEEVIKIASIVEIGTLLSTSQRQIGTDSEGIPIYGKQGSYDDFTRERESDLLAELDVWNKLQKMGFVKFDELGINKKAFFRIKEHIKRMHEALKGVVEITPSDDRKAIKKACLAGMINHVYKNTGYGYVNGDGVSRQLDRKSCLYYSGPSLVVGKPRIIEFKDSYGWKRTMDLVTIATKVSAEELKEIAPQFITEEETDCYYSSYEDAVKVTNVTYFKDIRIAEDTKVVPNHPDYAKLKAEYEGSSRSTYYEDRRQKTIEIDGRTFEVEYSWRETSITIDTYTLYHSDTKRIALDDGTQVTLYYYGDSWHAQSGKTMADLRNKVERARVKEAWDRAKRNLPELESFDISSALKCIPCIGKQEITIGNGGYGEPIYGFGCLSLQKNNSLKLELIEDEEKAAEKTKEAIEFLYGKHIKENYPEKKFKFLKGVKGLSKKEQKVKEEFDSEVRQLLEGLDVSNIEERISYLEELYNVLIEDLKVA